MKDFEKFDLNKKGETIATDNTLSTPTDKEEDKKGYTSWCSLPPACVFQLQQIALADDDMIKKEGAAEKYRFIARHILELFEISEGNYIRVGTRLHGPKLNRENDRLCQ